MRVGDIVHVDDASWSIFYGGHGDLVHLSGTLTPERRWRVLALGLRAPSTDPGEPNDTMLCEEGLPENILFTRAEFCRPATDARCENTHTTGLERWGAIVPIGATSVFIEFRK